MPNEEAIASPTEGVTENATATEAPNDFREYVAWRHGGLPEQEASPDATEPPAPEAESAPQSGAEDEQQSEDEEPENEDQQELLPDRGSRRQRKLAKLAQENAELKELLFRVLPPKANQPEAPAEPAKPKVPPNVPKFTDYTDLTEWQLAMSNFALEEREKQKEQEARKRAVEEKAAQFAAEWKTKVQTARQNHRDYDDVMSAAIHVEGPGTEKALEAVYTDESGPELLYYLASRPSEIKRIFSLHPVDAVREIGRISERLKPIAEKPKPKVSSAPPPPPSIGRPAKMSTDSIYDPAVQRDYRRYARARLRMEK